MGEVTHSNPSLEVTTLEWWAGQRGTRAQETTKGAEMRAQMNPRGVANVEATLAHCQKSKARRSLKHPHSAWGLVEPQAGPAPRRPGCGAKEHRPWGSLWSSFPSLGRRPRRNRGVLGYVCCNQPLVFSGCTGRNSFQRLEGKVGL